MNSTSARSIIIDLNNGDQLTSISCGHVVVELVKFLSYQRLQIPFTYQWLKQVVNKKKMSENQDKRDTLQAERHFRNASTALENLDFIIKSLLQEINESTIPEEVCIALGPSPVTFKEVYRLILPTFCHKPQCHSAHIASDQKIQRSIFKALVTSEKLGPVFFNPLPPTNMFILVKKKMNVQMMNDSFVQYSGCRIPKNSKVIVIDFRSQNKDNISCCNDFHVFHDANNQEFTVTKSLEMDDHLVDDFSEIESTDEVTWYQSTYVMKGFKDYIENGASITNSWLEC